MCRPLHLYLLLNARIMALPVDRTLLPVPYLRSCPSIWTQKETRPPAGFLF